MDTTLQQSRVIPFYRWAGIAFMLGNVFFLVNKLNEMSRLFLGRFMPDVISGQNPLLILTGQAALIIGYVGFLQRYSPPLSRVGKTALRLFCGGGMLTAVMHVFFISSLGEIVPPALRQSLEALFLVLIVAMILLIGGLIWFSILNLRQPVLGHWQWLPLATGLMGFIGFFLFSGEQITAVFLFFRTLFAMGLVGLGLVLWLEIPLQNDKGI